MNRRQFLATSVLAASAIAAPPKWRVAVIGHTGRGNYGHGLDTMWLQLPETQVVAIADPDPAGLATARKKLNDAPGFSDYRVMLGEIKPDLVSIGPRHVDQHRDMLLAAIDAGARGIYIEKPFVRTPAEADEVIAAAKRAGTRIAIAHRNRYHPALAEAGRIVEAGAIGRLLEVRARGKEDKRGGPLDLWVLGSHVLNMAFFFTGAPRACTATVLQGGQPATKTDVREGDEGLGLMAGNEVHSRIDTEKQVPIFFDSIADAGDRNAGFGLQLIGTQGVINLRADGTPFAYLISGSPFMPRMETRPPAIISSAGPGVPEPIENLREQVAHHIIPGRDLIAAIDGNRPPLCSAEDGLAVTEAIAGIFESHVQGGRLVSLPLKSRDNPFSRL